VGCKNPTPTFLTGGNLMATTFLTLVNDTLRRLNEVEIGADDFTSVIGFRAQVKDAVNASLHEISQREYFFPFNHTTGSLTLVSGTASYALATTLKIADWNSFRINYDADNDYAARKLKQINYDTFLSRYFERDSEATSGDYDQPTYIYRTPDDKAGFTQIPNAAYSVSYDYYAYHTDLSAATDTMTVPDAYKHVVIDGALYHCYMFRDNSQQAAQARQKFDLGIDHMRSILINRFTEIRDTRMAYLLNTPPGNP
jgi:hypothetical protein|tara:strand:- start:1310 stop:2074 length:765 start_codon:yes stop_codon:yes gene_type:complete